MIRRTGPLYLALLFAWGCASASLAPDADTRVFDRPYEEVWNAALAALPSAWGAPVERADAERGEVVFRKKVVTNDFTRSAKTGGATADPITGNLQPVSIERVDEFLTAYLRREGARQTRVQINVVFAGRMEQEATESTDEAQHLRLAKHLLDAIEMELRKPPRPPDR
jgi:hypothetical protein